MGVSFGDMPQCARCKRTIDMLELIEGEDGQELVIYRCHGDVQRFIRYPGVNDGTPTWTAFERQDPVV